MKAGIKLIVLIAGAALVLSGCVGWMGHRGGWDGHRPGYHHRGAGPPPCVDPDSEAARRGYPICR